MLAPQVLDHRALARGIVFNNPTKLYITRWSYVGRELQLHIGAYHPIVWTGRDYFIGPAMVSSDWGRDNNCFAEIH